MKKKTAQLIKMTGEMISISPKNGRDFKLSELQTYVDGIIDIVNCPNSDNIFVVDDEGILKNKDYNHLASVLCSIEYKKRCSLYGDVVYCHTKMVK